MYSNGCDHPRLLYQILPREVLNF